MVCLAMTITGLNERKMTMYIPNSDIKTPPPPPPKRQPDCREVFIPNADYKEPDVDLIDLDRVIVHDDNGKTYKIICDIYGNLHLKKISNQFLKIQG